MELRYTSEREKDAIYQNVFPEGPKILFSVKISRFWMGWAAVRRGFSRKERKRTKVADPQCRPHRKWTHVLGYPSLVIGSVFLSSGHSVMGRVKKVDA